MIGYLFHYYRRKSGIKYIYGTVYTALSETRKYGFDATKNKVLVVSTIRLTKGKDIARTEE